MIEMSNSLTHHQILIHGNVCTHNAINSSDWVRKLHFYSQKLFRARYIIIL